MAKAATMSEFRLTKSEENLAKPFQIEATIDAPVLRPKDWGVLERLNTDLSQI